MTMTHDDEPGSKRADILKAAKTVFLNEGFTLASMEVIAREAGVSKQTIYNHFGGKNELFEAFARARCERMSEGLEAGFNIEGGDPEKVLTALGNTILGVMLSQDAMRLKQLLQSECQRHPQLAEIFYSQGSDRVANRLARYFADRHAEGTLTVDEPRLTAEQFISMLGGHLRLRNLIGLSGPPTDAERDRYVANAVAVILNGTRPREA